MRDIGSNLANKQLINNIETILDKSIEAGINHIDITGTSIESSEIAKEIVNNHKRESLQLNFTSGFHPHSADKFCININENLMRLNNLLVDKSCSMVGELGLDYNRMFSTRENQIKCFEIQLDNANNYQDKPLFLHNRDSFEDFFNIIKNDNIKNKKIIHCFTGNKIEAKKFLENDFYFGITGWICDKKRNTDLIEALKIIPVEKLLIETDSPYLIPLNMKKVQRKDINYPYYLTFIVDKISEIKNVDKMVLLETINKTENELFSKSTKKLINQF